MSKSKGNVIDPLSVIDTYGTDAFRFTLAAFAAQGRDIKMSEQRIQGYRHFINKLWNAARLSLMHIDKDYTDTSLSATTLPDRWILARLNEVTRSVESALDTYRFNDAAGLLYNFVWHEFCDWYLEAIKPILYGKTETDAKETTLAVLWTVLRNTLILLHPFIPFVTEEIWHQLPGAEGSIMRAAFPSDQDAFAQISPDPEAEAQMALLTQIITGVRNVRGELDLAPALALDVIVQSDDASVRRTIDTHTPLITNLARVKSLVIENPGKKPASAATTLIDGAAIFVPLEGVIDFNKESERLQKRIAKVNQELNPMIKKLNNEDFLQKAPENVVQKTQAKHSQLLETLHKLESTLAKIQSLAG
jgi:valyl-tRNA synthetase